MKKTITIIIFCILILSIFYHRTLLRLYDGYRLHQSSVERSKYYRLQKDAQLQDITQKIIADNTVPTELKKPLINGERRIVIFKYLSGTNEVGGYFSYIVKGEHPTMIFLRGGNGFLGIMRPNNKFSFLPGYNMVGTLYRGNIYGGDDEFGGKDINDIENLINYFPKLEKFTKKKLQPPFAMLGVSRGAMEMFIALSRLEYVKQRVTHAIAVSGNVDLNTSMQQRIEMKYLFKEQFKKSNAKDFHEWLAARNPVANAKNLASSLKVLLVYGLSDNRVVLQEQTNFLAALQQAGICSQLITVSAADHGFTNNYPDLERIVLNFMGQ